MTAIIGEPGRVRCNKAPFPWFGGKSKAAPVVWSLLGDVPAAVRDWCIANGDDKQCRIVLAGYDCEHPALLAHGWTEHEWFAGGFLSGGYGNIDGSSQQHRERLWASPHCVKPRADDQMRLFGDDDD